MKGRETIHSTCLGCIGNCGAIYEVEDNKIVKVKGDPDHPLTNGYLCPKGAVVEDVRSSPDRLRHPLKRAGNRGEAKWHQITWNEAMDEISERVTEVKNKYGPEAFTIADGFIGVLSGIDPVVGKFLHLFGSPNRLVDLHN